MRKLATVFLLMITFGMVFAGAVSAQEPTTVDVIVVDENGDPVDVTCQGTDVAVIIDVSTEVTLYDPFVNVTVDPETGLEFDPEEAIMFFNGVEYTNENLDFFYWGESWQSWIWWIGWVDNMDPNDVASFIVPAKVTALGPITVNGDLCAADPQLQEYVVINNDYYTFLSVPCRPPHPVNGATVPMQNTGSPLAVAALGLLGIIGGAVYGKLK